MNEPSPALSALLERLEAPHREVAGRFPGDSGHRQPVHTVYGGAHLFKANTTERLGQLALRAVQDFAPDARAFGAALGWSDDLLGEAIHQRVLEKLGREPVEDFRIDFEDGFGHRPDPEEDAEAVRAAEEVARGMAAGSLPPFLGIRIKPLSTELKRRSARTLHLFLKTLVEAGGGVPENFVVTLPKITTPEEVEVLVALLETLEGELGLAPGSLRFEIMIETPQSIFGPGGGVMPARLAALGDGRCVAAHFGTYDYTASNDITAAYQQMDHPACDFARHVMQVSLAGTGVWISDGATNVLPVAPHRAAPGEALTAAQEAENRATVHAAWRLHYRHVWHSLEHAFYQGWDLHPAQLPTRYAAVYRFFLEGLDAAGARLTNFVNKAAQATLVGDVFDDAATGQGLLNYFLRAINCGAVTEAEATAKSGLSPEELEGRSFLKILNRRR